MIDMQFDWEGLLFEQCHCVHWQCVIVGIHGNKATCVLVQTCECSWVHLFLFERAFLNIDNRFTRPRLLFINFRIERTQRNFPKNGFCLCNCSGHAFGRHRNINDRIWFKTQTKKFKKLEKCLVCIRELFCFLHPIIAVNLPYHRSPMETLKNFMSVNIKIVQKKEHQKHCTSIVACNWFDWFSLYYD